MLGYLDTFIGFAFVMLVISLLITILTQVISALINHRGSNLKWGIKILLSNIDAKQLPNLTKNADQVAQAVLSHCLVSDSWFSENRITKVLERIPPLEALFRRYQLARAIRPAEFTAILKYLSSNTFADQKELAAEIRKVLGIADVEPAALAAGAIQGGAGAIADAEKLVQTQIQRAEQAADRLQEWFNSMMDRVSQKFAMYMRIWTVLFAAGFAFGFGLNTIGLIGDLYRNSTLRNSLVAAADQVLASSAPLLDSKNSLAARYSAAMQQALKEAGVTASAPIPVTLATPDDFAQWAGQNVPEAQRSDVMNRFNTLALAASRDAIQNSFTAADALITTPGFRLLKFQWPWERTWSWSGLAGVLASVGLLSLGAPFWFNTLKTATNLRSVVAAKESDETQQSST